MDHLSPQPRMIELNTFCALVDSNSERVSPISNDLNALYRYVGLPLSSAMSLSSVTDALYARIAQAIGQKRPSKLKPQVTRLLSELILKHVLDGLPLQPYATTLEILRDALHPSTAEHPQDDRIEWAAAVQAALDFQALRQWGGGAMFESSHPRPFAGARAALKLRQEGYEVSIEKDRVCLEVASEKRLTARICELVRLIGGLNVAAHIMMHLRPLFDSDQQRYHQVRRVSTTPRVAEPAVPWGYLVQLAAKHPTFPSNPPFAKENWLDLIDLSTSYAAIHDLQPYSVWDSMFKDSGSLLRFLQEVAVYDSFFSLVQTKPIDAIRITRGLLAHLPPTTKVADICTLGEVITVAETVLKMGDEHQVPIIFRAVDVANRCPAVSTKLITEILDRILSHPLPGANQKYFYPTGDEGPDFIFRPFLSLGNRSYSLLSPPICATAVVEAILTPLRDQDKVNFDGILGTRVEELIRNEFATRGIPSKGGKYQDGGKEWECDLVIETDDVIILVEVKKKVLTRKARAGSDVTLLIDLAESLLHAQLQAGRHELMLKKQGFLDLTDANGDSTRLELGGKEVERIAVTLNDFGGFQDRTLLEQFLSISSNLEFQPVDPTLRKKFDALNAKIVELRAQVQAWAQTNPRRAHQPFFHCWFLSVPQFLILMESVHSAEDFKKELWRTRHLSFGSLDFYHDYAHAKKLGLGNGPVAK